MINKVNKGGKTEHRALYILLIASLAVVFLIIGSLFFLYSKFKVGEFVFKQEENVVVGEIQGVSFPVSYLIQWQDGSVSDAPFFAIKKLSELGETDIENVLQNNNKQYEIYTGRIKEIGTEIAGEADSESEAEEIIPGQGAGNEPIKIKEQEGGCDSRFLCDAWTQCQVEYDLYSLATEHLSYGLQYRYCKDPKECMSDFIDSRTCTVKENIEIKKLSLDGENYLEIYDEAGKLIGRVKESYLTEDFKKLDIDLII